MASSRRVIKYHLNWEWVLARSHRSSISHPMYSTRVSLVLYTYSTDQNRSWGDIPFALMYCYVIYKIRFVLVAKEQKNRAGWITPIQKYRVKETRPSCGTVRSFVNARLSFTKKRIASEWKVIKWVLSFFS